MKKFILLLVLLFSLNSYSEEKNSIRYISSYNWYGDMKTNMVSVVGISVNKVSILIYSNDNSISNYDQSEFYKVQSGFMILYKLPTVLNYIDIDLGCGYDDKYYLRESKGLIEQYCKSKSISINYIVGLDILKLLQIKNSPIIFEPNVICTSSFQPRIGFTLGYKIFK